MTAKLTGRDFLIGLLLERTLMDDGQDLKLQLSFIRQVSNISALRSSSDQNVTQTREIQRKDRFSFSMFDSGHDDLMKHVTPRSSSDEDLLMNLSLSLCSFL
jgi:hypothetical protein